MRAKHPANIIDPKNFMVSFSPSICQMPLLNAYEKPPERVSADMGGNGHAAMMALITALIFRK
jgi:hypothetical protein